MSLSVVYFSSVSENAPIRRELGVSARRIPVHDRDEALTVDEPYVLITPTYGGAAARRRPRAGICPQAGHPFFNDLYNRSLIRGVIAAGNRTSGPRLHGRRHHRRQVQSPLSLPIELRVPPRTSSASARGSPSSSPLTPCRLRTSRPAPPIRSSSAPGGLSCRRPPPPLRPRRPAQSGLTRARPGTSRGAGLPCAQRDAQPVRRRREDPVREGSRAANQYFLQHVNQNTVFFHDLDEKLDYLVEENYEPRCSSATTRVHPRAVRLRVQAEVPLPDVPRRVPVLHQLHAEDLRREALPGALRGPCLHGGADAGRRRRGARANSSTRSSPAGSSRPRRPS